MRTHDEIRAAREKAAEEYAGVEWTGEMNRDGRRQLSSENYWALENCRPKIAAYLAGAESNDADIQERDDGLERERMRLAACGVAALGNTVESVNQRIGRDNPYWSASYRETCAAVDREMALRSSVTALEARLAAQEEVLSFYADENNYEAGFSHDGCETEVDRESGNKAREALARLRENKDKE